MRSRISLSFAATLLTVYIPSSAYCQRAPLVLTESEAIAILEKSTDDQACIRAIIAFRRSHKRSTSVTERLLAIGLSTRDETLRYRAIEAIGVTCAANDHDRLGGKLMDLMANTAESDLHAAIAGTLGRLSCDSELLTKQLIRLAGSGDSSRRAAAYLALGKKTALREAIVTTLVLGIHDNDPYLFHVSLGVAIERPAGIVAIQALEHHKKFANRASGELANALISDNREKIVSAARTLLSVSDNPQILGQAEKTLQAFLNVDATSSVHEFGLCEHALGGISKMDSPTTETLRRVSQLIESDDEFIVEMAAETLAVFPAKALFALPVLRQRLLDRNRLSDKSSQALKNAIQELEFRGQPK